MEANRFLEKVPHPFTPPHGLGEVVQRARAKLERLSASPELVHTRLECEVRAASRKRFDPAMFDCDDFVSLLYQLFAEFAEVVFVKHNVEQGWAKSSDTAKRYVSVEKFRETIFRLHPDGYPTRITVTGYKPMFNEKAIYIFLSGENSGKQFQYTLTLECTAASDYRVSVITRTS